MRILLAVMLAAGLALLVAGAADPKLFLLSLLGMLVLAGTASAVVAGAMQHVRSQAPH